MLSFYVTSCWRARHQGEFSAHDLLAKKTPQTRCFRVHRPKQDDGGWLIVFVVVKPISAVDRLSTCLCPPCSPAYSTQRRHMQFTLYTCIYENEYVVRKYDSARPPPAPPPTRKGGKQAVSRAASACSKVCVADE